MNKFEERRGKAVIDEILRQESIRKLKGEDPQPMVKASIPITAYRKNQDKIQVRYLFGRWWDGVLRVYEFGAKKYNPWNFLRGNGLPWVTFIESCERHIREWVMGEELDKESGLHHIDHAIANLIMLRESILQNKGTDDRAKDL